MSELKPRTIFQKIYSGDAPARLVYRGDEEVCGATVMLDRNQHNLGQMVAFLGAEEFSGVKQAIELPLPQQLVLLEMANFAIELATAREIAPEAFLTRTEKQVPQAHYVIRPGDFSGDDKDERLATLFSGSEILDKIEADNLLDRLSLGNMQRRRLTSHLAQIARGNILFPDTGDIVEIAHMHN